MPLPVIIRKRGLTDYAETFAEMQHFTAARNADTTDEIWLLEHAPVYTLGTHADHSHVLASGTTPVVHTDRGGQVTWHGPGQLVVYVLLDLQRAKLGIRELVCRLERGIIGALGSFNITATGRTGAPGVYCGEQKIASVGLRIRKHCSYHGIAINVCNDLQPFAGINPCGYAGMAVTRTCDQGGPADINVFAEMLIPQLLEQLQLEAVASHPSGQATR
jgi:lipoyl(octanoyl) transferase